ncbi:MAG: right-handed parallel beta-helix repeat-containing protein, partial [Gemmatimonadetes bacterium]|nr:right-handed parallel beta-helix repeat-containing protein [Gemmatimonadota bacterium]
ARYVDTLLVRDVLFRSPQADAYYGSLYVDSAEVVLVQRSEFFGSGVNDYYYYYDSGVWVDWARVVSLDSVLVSDYGYNGGVYLYTVDSLFVRGSVIRQNYGYGISCNYCYAGAGAGVAAVLTGNRFVQNNYGHVYFNGIRQARFDHNVLVGGGYDAISLYGDTLRTLVTLLGDSITTRQGGWINLSNFDSLGVDSVVVREREYGYPDIRGGRIAAVTNTKFLELEGYGINISASPRDSSRLVLRNVQFHGDSAGSRSSAYAVVAYQTSVDADGVALSWLNELFYVNYGDLTLRNVTATQFYRLAYVYSHPSYRCGSTLVSNVTASRGQYALYASGCAGDSLVVDNSTFRQVRNYGVVSDIVGGRITNSLFEYVGNAIESDCGSLRVADVTVRYGDYGLDAYGCASTDSLIVKRSRFERFDVYGVYASSIHALIDTSTFADNYDNVEHYYGSLLARDNQIHRPRGDGLNAFRPATAVLERNSVACDLTRSAGGRAIYLYGSAPDSLAITGNAAAGCSNGIVVDGSPVQALVRGNTVTLPDTALYGIWVEASTAAGGLARVVGNSVSGPAKYGSIRVDYAWRAEVDTNSVDRSIQAGIYAFDVDSLFIRDNVLTNHAAGTCCILLRNRITDTRASGIALVRTSSTDTVTVLVDSNTVKRADSVGIWVRYYHRAYLRKNAIDSARLDAVQLNQYSGVPPAMAHRNNFSNSGRYGVYNTLPSVTINADTNYWNGPNGPRGAFGNPDAAGTAADSVSQYVSWADYLTDAEPTLVPAPALVAAASFMTPALMVAPAASLAAPSAADATTVWIEPAGGERPIPVFHAPPRPRAASPADGRPLPPHVLEASQRQVDELEARLAERQRRLEARAAMRAEQEARARERQRRRTDERAAVEQARASGRQPQ